MDKKLYTIINQLLWDLTVAQRNIQILHWNIKDCSFIYMHEYLGQVYDTLFGYIDTTAESLRFQDCFPKGKLSDSVANSDIPVIDSSKTYNHKEVVCLALSNILALKNSATQVLNYASDTNQGDIVDPISGQIGYYSKVIYFLRNSLLEDCCD